MANSEHYLEKNIDIRMFHERLKVLLSQSIREDGRVSTSIKDLFMTRWSAEGRTNMCFLVPSINIVAQGRKEFVMGKEVFRYGELDCFVNGIDLTGISRIINASQETPLLEISLDIDIDMARELSVKVPLTSELVDTKSIFLFQTSIDILGAFVRLIELFDNPDHLLILAPVLKQEIIARVLASPQGSSLRKLYTSGTYSCQIIDAMAWLRENFVAPFRVEDLAARVGMATSSFHRQFKKVTSVSPLQYQKWLRLHEAQRLMLVEKIDTNNAGRAVGYNYTQQFSREYKRMFGSPPFRNIKQLKKT